MVRHSRSRQDLAKNTCLALIDWLVLTLDMKSDMKSHTGATLRMGQGHPISRSTKQQLNMKSSTEAELIGADDTMGKIL